MIKGLAYIADTSEITEEDLEKLKNTPGQIVIQKKRAPRIGFTITEAQSSALERFVPWGNLTALYQAITEDLLELFEKHGSAKILAAVISRQIKFYDISKTLKEANDSEITK